MKCFRGKCNIKKDKLMVVLHIFISVAAPCDKSIVRAAIHRIPNFNLLSYKYRIQKYKITNTQIQNYRNKELHNICNWSIVAASTHRISKFNLLSNKLQPPSQA